RHNGLPVLSSGLESSVDGLHFVGSSAVASFGPQLRFIAGAGFAARRVTRAAMSFALSPPLPTPAAGGSRPHAVPGALVVGGAHVSIGVARSLGRHGIPVWLLAGHPLPKFSRYVRRSLPWPGA